MGFAIVGLGRLSLEEILPAFGRCKYARPVALVSGDREKAEKVGRMYGIDPKNLYDYSSFDKIRDNEEVAAVYVVLPNAMHLEYTVRAAQAGKHVLCEKPMANTSRECQEMISACEKAGKALMIAYRCQYEPHHRAAIASIRSEEFGPLRSIEAVNCQNIDPTNSGGSTRPWPGAGRSPISASTA